MKKITLLLVIAAGLISATGCKKGLDATVYGVLSPMNFPGTEAEYEAYAMEAYKPFGSKWGYNDAVGYQYLFHGVDQSNILLNDGSADAFIKGQRTGNWELIASADFVGLKNINKSNHFEKVRFVTRLTKILSDLEKAPISEVKKKQLITEVRIARGWLMYYLLTIYGPVPVILDASKIGTAEETNLTRPERTAYVSSIISDVRFAADNLEKSPAQYGRFNKGLALAVLLRTFLFEKDYAKAEQVGREILPLGYSMVSDYKSLFREATEKNNETLWAVSADPTGDGNENKSSFNGWGKYVFPDDYPGMLTGTTKEGGWSAKGALIPSWSFYDSFDPTDKRRECLLSSYTTISGAPVTRAGMKGPIMNKYPDEATGAYQGNDIPVVRYADVLLMLAEAINGQNGPTAEAIGFVTQVRARAGVGNLSTGDVASKDAFATAILRERGWELFFEGFRRVDLMRFGKWNEYVQAAGKTPNPANANGYYPIPQYVINAGQGKLAQTPGY